MIRNTFNSYFKSLLKTTSTTNKSNANETFPNLSLRQFHDKIIIKATSKLSVVRKEQIKKALSAYDSLGLSDEQFEKQLVSEAGVVIAGISYQIKPVINSPFFWLSVSRKLNPTKDIKPQLIESKKYDLGKEGKPYKDGVFNFIQDSAIISNINFVAQASFNKIISAYDDIIRAIEFLGIKRYHCSFEVFEVNTSINTVDIDADFRRTKQIARYLFGKPVIGGNADDGFADYHISKHLRLKFYKKVIPSADGQTPGLIRMELVIRELSFKDFAGIYALVYRAQNELAAYATYFINVLLNNEKNDANPCKLPVNYPELLENPVPSLAIPSHLNGCFTQIPAKSLCKRNVLLPELLAKKLRGEI